MASPSRNVTDRAKRYRAQNNVTGPKRCVICGSRQNLGVMYLTGNEDHGESKNLAWGCKSCNGILGAAFKRIGAGRPTRQYNPASGHIPTYEQYTWAVTHHTRGEHDEGGAVIHATPKHKRIEYAKRIAAFAAPARRAGAAQRRADFEDRWNPASEALFSRANDVALKHGYHLKRADSTSRTYDHPRGDRVMVDQSRGRFYHSLPQELRGDRDASGSIGTLNAFLAKTHRRDNPWPFSSRKRSARDTTPASGGIAKFSKLGRGRGVTAPASRKGKSAPASGYSRVPDEKTIQEGFKRGLSLAEILRQNPGLAKRLKAPEIGGPDFKGAYLLDEQLESIRRQMERVSITSKLGKIRNALDELSKTSVTS